MPALDQLSRRGEDVVRTASVRGGKIFAQERSRTAWPEEQPDAETDRKADRDILDSNDADTPADRLDDVEEDEEDDGKAGLSRSERDRPRCVGGEQHGDRQHSPQHRLVRPDADDQERADDDADRRSRQRAED